MMQTKLPFLMMAIAVLSACATTAPAPGPAALETPEAVAVAAAPETPVLAPIEPPKTLSSRIADAVQHLDRGDVEKASNELTLALKDAPKDATARRLMSQIDTDPVVLLGPAVQTYVVVTGDTMSAIADRFLGDHLMFFALSRYNGLSSPRALRLGQTLKIPKSAKVSVLAAAAPVAPLVPKAPAETAAAASTASPASKASALRLSALENLNNGHADRAVEQLNQAKSLNPQDASIERDLARALKIQTAMTSKTTLKKTGMGQ
jgi:LysM repeat protein